MNKNILSTLVLLIFSFEILIGQESVTLSGYVYEKGSRETLPGVNILLENSSIGTASNAYGFFSLDVPKGKEIKVRASFVGFMSEEKVLQLKTDTNVEFLLKAGSELKEIVVSAVEQADRISDQVEMSKVSVPVEQIKKIPALLGEKDVLKVLQLMPGVQNGSEGQSGLYVRGGGPDQNLIILDEAPVYNANHLFGFFSVFNGDAIKSVELTKGGFPAQFGGRLSSVVNMRMKEGNKEEFHGEGGIGIISSRLTLEGPIKNGKTSFLVSCRRTYLDVLARPIIKSIAANEGVSSNIGYYFYDLNAKVNHEFSKKDKLYLSGYFGQDVFYADVQDGDFKDNSGLDWGNATGTLRWNHVFNPKLFSNVSLIYSKFNFGVGSTSFVRNDVSDPFEEDFSLRYDSRIQDIGVKADIDYFPNNQHTLKLGINAIWHLFQPSAISVKGGFNDTNLNFKEREIVGFETAVYAEDTWQVGQKVKINGGLRLSHFGAEGKNYINLEPRLAAAYKLSPDLALKASYAIMNQYIHLLSNTGIGLPTDLWVPTTDIVKPQQSEQVAIGMAKDFKKKGLMLSLEAYYKDMSNIVSYKEGASFLNLNGSGNTSPSFEEQITQGKGWSYGLEFLLQKKVGKFTGWVGYTWSKTEWNFADLNFGNTFFPRYDRRHDISLVGMYELNKRISLSATWVYGTGNALTIPKANYVTLGHDRQQGRLQDVFILTDYGKRNSFRAEPFHRLDAAVQFHKKKKHWDRTWEFGFYNAYNRRNPFFYRIAQRSENVGTLENPEFQQKTVLSRLSLFPIIPSISYSFKF